MTQDENKCIFCGEEHMEGLRLRGKLICPKCEKELLETQLDEPAYEDFKEGIKIVWEDDESLTPPEEK